ncbi:unnamed protein product [Dovyalis caffra]|uniref:Uncharacterized protein n=1 Tax=Dovyalis caffra TaxID=77055 RepID=A0AAV1S514_9ROSI|nr:unnamed protein product [Dovyalis caffra]
MEKMWKDRIKALGQEVCFTMGNNGEGSTVFSMAPPMNGAGVVIYTFILCLWLEVRKGWPMQGKKKDIPIPVGSDENITQSLQPSPSPAPSPSPSSSQGIPVITRHERKRTLFDGIEEGLARARAAIYEAVRSRNSSSHKEGSHIPRGAMYRNQYAFHQLSYDFVFFFCFLYLLTDKDGTRIEDLAAILVLGRVPT